jgi:hypothetical protein
MFWLVARHEHEHEHETREMRRVGESTCYSGLYVDESGIPRITNPDLRAEDLTPYCTCCTHTFNGVRFGSRE